MTAATAEMTARALAVRTLAAMTPTARSLAAMTLTAITLTARSLAAMTLTAREPAAVALVAAVLAACTREPDTLELRGHAMGTTYTIKVATRAGAARPSAARLSERVAAHLGSLEDTFSTYRPNSEVSRFNAGTGQDWFDVSAAFLDLLEQGVEASELSGGAFDITVGPLVELWGFGAGGASGPLQVESALTPPTEAARLPSAEDARMPSAQTAHTPAAEGARLPPTEAARTPSAGAARPPSAEAVQRRLAATGFAHVQWRTAPPAVRRTRPGVRLDFSAIAKGYAVDEICRLLEADGLTAWLVEIGGEVRVRGRRADGADWSIGIERAAAPGVAEAVPLRDAAIATSGDYRNHFEYRGRRYSHILDPRTGWPVAHDLASVSVIASTAARADALATALLVLGPEHGLALAEREGIAARLEVRSPHGATVLRTSAYPAGLGDARDDTDPSPQAIGPPSPQAIGPPSPQAAGAPAPQP